MKIIFGGSSTSIEGQPLLKPLVFCIELWDDQYYVTEFHMTGIYNRARAEQNI